MLTASQNNKIAYEKNLAILDVVKPNSAFETLSYVPNVGLFKKF